MVGSGHCGEEPSMNAYDSLMLILFLKNCIVKEAGEKMVHVALHSGK